MKFIVTDDIMVDAILRLDFVQESYCIIDCGTIFITFPHKEFSLPRNMVLYRYNSPRTIGFTILAGSELEVKVSPLEKIVKGAWIMEGKISGQRLLCLLYPS